MTGLTEQELTEIKRHMLARDHLNDGTPWDEQWCDVYSELADDVPGLVAEVQTLRELLFRFVDGEDECSLDHHGNCQAHRLGNPCEVAQARQLLGTGGRSRTFRLT